MSAAVAPRLEVAVRGVEALGEAERRAMFRLYERYYDATDWPLFHRDLGAKSHVIELRDDGELRGFSTLRLYDFEADGARGRAIFSGDTIIDEAYWGDQALVDGFCRFAGGAKALEPAVPLYWFLISKGYRTYRYLGLFAHDYYPRHDRATPPEIARRMDALAAAKFGAAYDAASGLVRFDHSRGHLRPRWAGVPGHLRDRHPAVRFFLERNPRYHTGEEMVCLTELRPDNLRSFARRAFLRGMDEVGGIAGA